MTSQCLVPRFRDQATQHLENELTLHLCPTSAKSDPHRFGQRSREVVQGFVASVVRPNAKKKK